jgi:hypothetical protein
LSGDPNVGFIHTPGSVATAARGQGSVVRLSQLALSNA